MNDEELKRRMLHQLAEERVPDSYDPWEVLQENPEFAGLQRRTALNGPFRSRQNVRLAFLAAVVLVGIIFFMTPLGSAVAGNILSLFTRAESDVRLVPAGQQIEMIQPIATAVPTQMVGLQPVTSDSSFWTPTPASTQKSDEVLFGLTLGEAEALAQFAVTTPADIPAGYSLAEVLYNQGSAEVIQIYKYFPYQSGEMFLLHQRTSLPDDAIGQSADVEQMMVGDVVVEAVSGSWFSPAGSTTEQWEAEAPVHTFRWQKDGFTFTLEFWVGDTFSPAYLSAPDMQALIEVVMGVRSTLPERVNLNNLESIEAVRAVSEQPVLAPSVLPEDFIFSYAAYEPGQRVVLIYEPEAGSRSSGNASLVIFEIPLQAVSGPTTYEDYPADAVETVAVGAYTGTLVRGAVVDGRYDPDLGPSLTWQTGELSITIRFQNASSYAARLEPEDLITIAESMQ